MSRITPGTLMVFTFAVVFGLLGAYVVKHRLTPPPAAAAEPRPAGPAAVQVPLASVDVEAGRALTLGDIMIVSLTPEQVKERGLSGQFMTNSRQIIGRVLNTAIAKGQTFTPGDFYPEGTGPTVAQRLQPGHRAVTISVAEPGDLNGLAPPQSIVDVLFRTTANDEEFIPEATHTLVEGAEVLAVGRNMVVGSRIGEAANSVTLAVTPAQAHALKVVEGRGVFSLSLRSAEEEVFTAQQAEPATLRELLGIEVPAAIETHEEPVKTFTTEIYRAGSRQVNTFTVPARRSDVTTTDRKEQSTPQTVSTGLPPAVQ